MSAGNVLFQRFDRVACITLDRVCARNRISAGMAGRLQEICAELRMDTSVRVVVVTGMGDFFSCGWEFSEPGAVPIQAAAALADLNKPVIAVLNGDAVDHGLELALACDIRIAIEGSHMGITVLEHGLIPWDGGTQRLPRIVGRAKALQMLMMGELVDASDALASGLVNLVVSRHELKDATDKVVACIANGAPIAMEYAKEAVTKGLDMTLGQGMRLEADLSFLLHSTQDRAEGLRSFLERRRPNFYSR